MKIFLASLILLGSTQLMAATPVTEIKPISAHSFDNCEAATKKLMKKVSKYKNVVKISLKPCKMIIIRPNNRFDRYANIEILVGEID